MSHNDLMLNRFLEGDSIMSGMYKEDKEKQFCIICKKEIDIEEYPPVCSRKCYEECCQLKQNMED